MQNDNLILVQFSLKNIKMNRVGEGHMPPSSRCGSAFKDFPDYEQGAARNTLKMLWSQHCKIEAVDMKDVVRF